jgi:hypothetical protein
MFPAIHGVQGRGPRRVYEDLCQCEASPLLFLAVRQNTCRRGTILASGNALLTAGSGPAGTRALTPPVHERGSRPGSLYP